jgi:hypothetical protein
VSQSCLAGQGRSLRTFYALTDHCHSRFTPRTGILRPSQLQEAILADLVYLTLTLGVFAGFALAARAADRM